MIGTIIKNGFVTYASDGNRARAMLKKFNIAPGRNSYILGAVFRFLWELIKKLAFVAIFMHLPRIMFEKNMNAGALGFGVENAFVYFTLVMVCFCGSINNSCIFQKTQETYISLFEVKCDPVAYFRFLLLRRGAYEFLTFFIAFTVFQMNPLKAMYLSIVIFCSRFIGDAINIMIFRLLKKSFSELRGYNVALMCVSLFLAYYVPYVRGYVPGAYDLIFDTLWLAIILVAGAIFIYYVWNYHSYNKIANAIYGNIAEYEENSSEKSHKEIEAAPEIIDDVISESMEQGQFDFNELNDAFLEENKIKIFKGIIFRCLFVALFLVAAIVIRAVSSGEILFKVIYYSLPIMIFVVFMISSSAGNCREFFYQCDYRLLEYSAYRERDTIMQNFFIRLKTLIMIDAIPNAFLVVTYVIAGMLAGQKNSVDTVVAACVGIMLLGTFFTFFNLFIYYILQPFSVNNPKKGNNTHIMISILVYIVCAIFIYVDTTTLKFAMGLGIALALFMAVSTTCIFKFGEKTFRIK